MSHGPGRESSQTDQLRALAPAFALAVVVLGKWNWWAPGPLARLHARIGVTEAAR